MWMPTSRLDSRLDDTERKARPTFVLLSSRMTSDEDGEDDVTQVPRFS